MEITQVKGITIDLIMSFPKVKSGGILGGDDYIKNIYHHDIKNFDQLVKPVIGYYYCSNKISKFLTNNTQFLIKKI